MLFVGRGRHRRSRSRPGSRRSGTRVGERARPPRPERTGSGGDDRASASLPDAAPRRSTRGARARDRARTLRTFRPDVIVASDPYVAAAALAAPPARALAREGDRRGARRSEDVHARSTARRRAGAVSPLADASRAASLRARRRDAGALARSPRRSSSDVRGRAGDRLLPDLQRPVGVRRPAARPVPDGAAARVRRRARAVQERRRARRGVASGRRGAAGRAR